MSETEQAHRAVDRLRVKVARAERRALRAAGQWKAGSLAYRGLMGELERLDRVRLDLRNAIRRARAAPWECPF